MCRAAAAARPRARLALLLLLAAGAARANYVTLTDRYTADPAPFVHDGRLYIFTSHDLEHQAGWLMTDYSLMSTDDLANWRDEGIVFDLLNQSWGVYAWAQQVIQGGDGRFYMYYPAMQARANDTRSGVGVAVSDSVTGPFNDALGHPLLDCGDDPTVLRDDDGTLYFCGNCGGPLCAQLAPNMTSLLTVPSKLSPALPDWFEAPWLTKWRGTYYLSYMCNGNGLGNFSHYGWDICYGSCSGPGCSPLGPYTFRGSLMWSPPGDCGPVGATCEDPTKSTGENNHQGIVEFPEGSGHLYFAYHTRVLSKSRGEYVGYQRNVAIDRLYARADAATFPLPANLPWVVDPPGESSTGFIPVSATPSWSRQLKYVDAFSAIPATLSAAMSLGLDTEPCAEGGLNLGYISDGSTTMLRGVDFGAGGASAITLRVATPLSGVSVSVFADGLAVLSDCAVPNTGGWQTWTNVTCALSLAVQGVMTNLTLRFSCAACAGGLLNLRFFSFTAAAASASTPGAAAAVPPPVTVLVALRAMSNGLYVQVSPDPSSGGLLTPSGAASSPPLDKSLLFTLVDNEDGTFSLQAAGAGPAQGLFVCVTLGGSGPLRADAASTADACTRFWLYGTVFGSHALLSASNGRFVVSAASADPLLPTAQDPRGAAGDGARFLIEQQQQ